MNKTGLIFKKTFLKSFDLKEGIMYVCKSLYLSLCKNHRTFLVSNLRIPLEYLNPFIET